MSAMGAWLAINGESIYGTRPWTRPGDALGGSPVSYTTKGMDLFVLATDPSAAFITLPPELRSAAQVSWMNDAGAEVTSTVGPDGVVGIPEALRSSAVAVAVISGANQP